MAEKYNTQEIIDRTDLVELVSRYVQLRKEGTEYVGLCVAHADKKPSMYVVPDKKFVHCFACGYHQDAIGFLQAVEGIDFPEACKRLLNGSGTGLPNPQPVAQRERKRPPKRITTPPPDNAPPPDMFIGGIGGAPSMIWTYHTPEGKPFGYVARYETAEGKTIRCWTWGRRTKDEPEEWACGHFSDPRPLYNLHVLAQHPDRQIIITEGEKAADAAQQLFPKFTCMTWPGGAQAIHNADWSALKGKRVVLFPDNDEPGIAAMAKLANLLQEAGAKEIKGIRTATQPDGSDTPPKWDIADAEGWSPEIALEWAKPRVFTYDLPEPVLADADLPPISAYSASDMPPSTDEPDDTPTTQPAPVSAKLVGIYDQQNTGPAPTSASLGVISRRLSDVTVRALDWLWPGKIPCGKVTGISGNPGLGKSQITASLAAIVSTGGRWPVTREKAQQGSVLLLNAEDDADDTLAPRLIAAGADLSCIHTIDAVRVSDDNGISTNRGLDLVRDIDRIAIKMQEIGDVRLVIIDPVSAYMGKDTDTHKMADVVSIMARLKELASRTRCAIIMVNHLNKSSGGDALLRTQGSIGFVSHARAVWGVVKDKDDPNKRYFGPLKNNLGPDSAAASLAYSIEEYHLPDSDPPIITSRILWESQSSGRTMQELMAAAESGDDSNSECVAFLLDILEHGPVPVNEIRAQARKAGHLHGTVNRVKAQLKIEHFKMPGAGAGGHWAWRLPNRTPARTYGNRED